MTFGLVSRTYVRPDVSLTVRPSKGRRSEMSLVSRKVLTAALCCPTSDAVSKSGSF